MIHNMLNISNSKFEICNYAKFVYKDNKENEYFRSSVKLTHDIENADGCNTCQSLNYFQQARSCRVSSVEIKPLDSQAEGKLELSNAK